MSYEKKSIVINVGAHSTVVGFSDTELPICIIPSTYMKSKKNEEEEEQYIFDKYDMLQIASDDTMNDKYDVFTLVDNNGLPYNWEGLERQWSYIFQDRLKCDPCEYPLAVSIPMIVKNTHLRVIMERYMKLAFEKFNIPIIQFILEPLATTFAMGKKTALVIDVGFNGCKVTPVFDGVVIKQGITKNKFGGAFLDYLINDFMNKKVKKVESGPHGDDDGDIVMDGGEGEAEAKEDVKTAVQIWYESNTWIQDFKSSILQVCDKDLNELQRYYQEQEQMYIKQQEQMKQLGGTGIVTGAVPAFNSNLVNVTNNPLIQKKNYLFKPLNKTLILNQKECLDLTENLFKPNLISDKFSKEDGLSEIISKSIKKTAATISNNNDIENDKKKKKNDGNEMNNSSKSNGNSSNSGSSNVNNVIRTIGASIIIPPKLVGSTSSNTSNNKIKLDMDQSRFFHDEMSSLYNDIIHQDTNNSGNTSNSNPMVTPEHVYSSLLTNVIIMGSTSLTNGMEQRIIQELSIRFPQYKLITFANQHLIDRQLQNWISCCTMANLPTWELGRWYSQEEYYLSQEKTTSNPNPNLNPIESTTT